MNQFVVVYVGDKIEVFGIFNSFEDASNWMKNDYTHNLEFCDKKRSQCVNNNHAEIEDYGTWDVIEINMVNMNINQFQSKDILRGLK